MFGYIRFLLAYFVLLSHLNVKFLGHNIGVFAVIFLPDLSRLKFSSNLLLHMLLLIILLKIDFCEFTQHIY